MIAVFLLNKIQELALSKTFSPAQRFVFRKKITFTASKVIFLKQYPNQRFAKSNAPYLNLIFKTKTIYIC